MLDKYYITWLPKGTIRVQVFKNDVNVMRAITITVLMLVSTVAETLF